MDTTGTVRRSRQLPGLACEECRRRKLRCDRERPQCGECVESGKECIVNHARSPRGPKKANAKALQSCLGKSSSDTRSNDLEVTSVSSATLERNGFEQQRRGRPQSQHARNQHSTLEVDFADTQNEHLSSFDLLDEDLTDEDVVPLVTPSASESRGQARTIGHAKSPPSALSAPSLDSVTQISEMAAADLYDQSFQFPLPLSWQLLLTMIGINFTSIEFIPSFLFLIVGATQLGHDSLRSRQSAYVFGMPCGQ